MPNPISRESLNVGLEQRYNTQKSGGAFDAKSAGSVVGGFIGILARYYKQKAGGAFDAKTAGVIPGDFGSNEFADGFTFGGQKTSLPKKDSRFLDGFSNKKYKS